MELVAKLFGHVVGALVAVLAIYITVLVFCVLGLASMIDALSKRAVPFGTSIGLPRHRARSCR
jgi:hypothetical protein